MEGESETFAGLGVCEALCDAVTKLGYTCPTEIQKQSLPFSLKGKDIIALAPTGSGKTCAFALPILQSLLLGDNGRPQPFYAMVLAPTRELAFQIEEHFQAVGAGIGVKCVTLVGGMDMMTQSIALARKPHIIVATPGRLVDHLENTKGFSLSKLKYLVFDEADRLLNMDFEKEVDKILQTIPTSKAGRRTLLFSATMTTKVAKLQRASLKSPVKVEVSSHKYETVENLTQEYVFMPAKHKDCYLVYTLNEIATKSAIVFCDTIRAAERATLTLRTLGIAAIPLHGKMQQTKRLGALNKFKASGGVLIATDVASRGLDIPQVDLVINYDIPTHSKDYVHRVGRTARAGRSGRSITFVTQYDVELFQRIEQLINKKMTEFVTDAESVLILQERVAEATRMASLEMRENGDSKLEAAINAASKRSNKKRRR